MGGEDNFCAAGVNFFNQFFDAFGSRGIEAGGWFIKEENLRPQTPRPGKGEALLFTAGQHPGLLVAQGAEIGELENLVAAVASGCRAESGECEGIVQIRGNGATQHDRALKNHRVGLCIGGGGPANLSMRRGDQAVCKAEEKRLPTPIRAKNQRALSGLQPAADRVNQFFSLSLIGQIFN